MDYTDIIKKIEAHMKEVGEARDKLDTFIDELEGLKYTCEDAYDNLWAARDALSGFV
jgi:hypothetical protein